MKINSFIILLAVLTSGFMAHAEQQPAAVNAGVGGSAGFQGVVLTGQATRTGQQGVTLNIVNTCFGTNLRHVSNPLSPLSTVEMYFSILDKGTVRNYMVKYPANVVSQAGNDVVVQIPAVNTTGGVTASYAGNSVRVVVPINYTTTVDAEGNMSDNFSVKLQSVRFRQVFAPGVNSRGAYMGYTGDLSGNIYKYPSKDGKQYTVAAYFPGENGFCGGYFSPLMVFFDDKRPQYTAQVDFPLNPVGKTMWPEKGAPGAFIAIDRNGDKKITTADELFGNQGDKFKNGFEALREFDSNKDDVVDGKDAQFDKLSLWFDKNGDGLVQEGEMVPLKSKIKSISLKYDASTTSSVGSRAEVRERSSFIFVDQGREKTGTVLDMWFAPK